MFEKQFVRRTLAAVFCAVLIAGPTLGQEVIKKGGSVPITFVPPPTENATYSIGIYETKAGKLVRRLCEAAGQNTFTVGLNGLITSWDGKDDDGTPLPPGKYAARGYAVGPLKVEGVEILDNSWAEDDENLRLARIGGIAVIPDDKGLAIVGLTPGGDLQVARYGGEKTEFLWQSVRKLSAPNSAVALSISLPKGGKFLRAWFDSTSYSFRLTTGEQVTPAALDGSPAQNSPGSGQDGTTWKIEEGVLTQYSAQGQRIRSLAPKEGDPVPVVVSASPDTDRIYLLEETKDWQRVRGLSLVETTQENGKQISNWKTVFERNIRASETALESEGVSPGKSNPASVEIALEDNPLAPSKREHAQLIATSDEKGSYLTTSDGLRLRQISQRTHLRGTMLTRDKTSGALMFYQTDGAARDVFSIHGTKQLTKFDAGDFEIDAAGEKPNVEKAPEPDL